MKRHRLLRMVAAMAATSTLVLAGCASTSELTSADGETRVVPTSQGDVTVPGNPQKVVVLNYALAGYLYDLDIPVKGITSEDTSNPAEFSEHWKASAETDGTEFIPWSGDGFNTEAIAAAQPDLIIAGGLGLPSALAVKANDQLSAIAPTVIVDKKLATWQQQFEFLADDVFGKRADYDRFHEAYQRRVDEVRSSITLPPNPVSFLTVTKDARPYLLIEDQGLPQTFAELGFQPAPLTAQNNFQPYRPGGDMVELSTERLGDVITTPTVFVSGFNGDTTDVAQLSGQRVYETLPAFAGKHAYDLPYWAVRGDYDDAMQLLDIVEEKFGDEEKFGR